MKMCIEKANNRSADSFRTNIVESLLSEVENLKLMARGRKI